VYEDSQAEDTADAGAMIPVLVAGLPQGEITQVSVSEWQYDASCADGCAGEWVYAVTSGGEVWGWGGAEGQTASEPRAVPGLTDVTQIALVAPAENIALLGDGTLSKWGGLDGPVKPVKGTNDIDMLVSSEYWAMAFDEDGYLWGVTGPSYLVVPGSDDGARLVLPVRTALTGVTQVAFAGGFTSALQG
jgi:hypothetical protein